MSIIAVLKIWKKIESVLKGFCLSALEQLYWMLVYSLLWFWRLYLILAISSGWSIMGGFVYGG
jgi:hypothetical protein